MTHLRIVQRLSSHSLRELSNTTENCCRKPYHLVHTFTWSVILCALASLAMQRWTRHAQPSVDTRSWQCTTEHAWHPGWNSYPVQSRSRRHFSCKPLLPWRLQEASPLGICVKLHCPISTLALTLHSRGKWRKCNNMVLFKHYSNRTRNSGC